MKEVRCDEGGEGDGGDGEKVRRNKKRRRKKDKGKKGEELRQLPRRELTGLATRRPSSGVPLSDQSYGS